MTICTSILLIFSFMAASTVYGQDWEIYHVGEGIHPALDVTASGIPHISFMLEGENSIQHAIWDPSTKQFNISTALTGSFGGPLAMTLDETGRPHISYHDHGFGNLTITYGEEGNWQTETVPDDGHDGWDSALHIDASGKIYAVSIDPDNGVEYAHFDGANWTVEDIGSGRVSYDNGTSITIDSKGQPHIAYYDDAADQLMHVIRLPSGWALEAVTSSDADAGRFPSIAIDNQDQVYIAHYSNEGRVGSLALSRLLASGWTSSIINPIGSTNLSTARKMIDLDLAAPDENGLSLAKISFNDEERVVLLDEESNWMPEEIEAISSADRDIFGQLTSMKQDAEGNLHVVYFKYDAGADFAGQIYYAVKPSATSSDIETPAETQAQDFTAHPNPSNGQFLIRYVLEEGADVAWSIYDIQGKPVLHLPNKFMGQGEHLLDIQESHLPAGMYWIVLQSGNKRTSKAHVIAR